MKRIQVVKNTMTGIAAAVVLAFAVPNNAAAHCDTLDGPVIQDAHQALETKDITPILKWVKAKDEKSVKAAFQKALAAKGPNTETAHNKFFATLVKIHRAGEGAPFTGLKPAGTVEPAVSEADKALASGSADALVRLVTDDITAGIMGAMQEIFREYAPEYRRRFGTTMPPEHHKVIDAILSCRTPENGSVVYHCEVCGLDHLLNCSCGNRHCPQCQNDKTTQWLERQMARTVPGPHFLVTFTVPEELRDIIRANQRIGYAALFAASAAAMKKLCLDPRHVGGNLPGFFGVLHTWGRQLQYHPHIHYVVPGGAIATADGTWKRSGAHFFLPVMALSSIFRAKLRDRFRKAGLLDAVPAEVWTQPWNVNSQAVGDSTASIKYLAPYVFRVAISDRRIVKVEQDTVFFRYRHAKSNRERTMALDALEFIRRFLQHVLPAGFMKVRYYGFLSPNASVSLEEVRAIIELAYGFEMTAPQHEPKTKPGLTCRNCGGIVRFLLLILPPQRKLPEPSG